MFLVLDYRFQAVELFFSLIDICFVECVRLWLEHKKGFWYSYPSKCSSSYETTWTRHISWEYIYTFRCCNLTTRNLGSHLDASIYTFLYIPSHWGNIGLPVYSCLSRRFGNLLLWLHLEVPLKKRMRCIKIQVWW